MSGVPPEDAPRRPEDKPLGIEGLLGLGLDGRRDDVHITRGENFYLYGGSKPTHEHMRETVLRLNDKVDARGKKLNEINARELSEIAGEVRKEMPGPRRTRRRAP
jgi:hypothetical protein